MKKRSMILSVLFIATLIAVPAFPLSYEIDVGQDGTFETGGAISLNVSESVTMDIYVDGYSCPPDDKLFGTLKYIYVDQSQVTVDNCFPYSVANGGVFDNDFSDCFEWEPNVYYLTTAAFAYVTVAGNQQKLGSMTLTCTAGGTFDLVVANDLTAYGYPDDSDGYIADCNLASQYPADAILTVNQNDPTIFPEVATTCPVAETLCPASETTCPVAETLCPVAETLCPTGETFCPVAETLCPSVETLCPASETSCPVAETLCPEINTVCPVAETFCPSVETACPVAETVCPIGETLCPAVETTCPVAETLCPSVETLCPTGETFCPVAETLCPSVETLCPASETSCPVAETLCPETATVCPVEATVCPEEVTFCPIETTVCPVGATFCPISETVCPETETVCPAAVCPLAYKFDFDGDRYWDTEWDLTPPNPPAPGETVQVDVWLNGYVCPPNDELFGVQLYFVYDPETMLVNQAYPNDTDHGGPFDPDLSAFMEMEPGIYLVSAANFNFVTVTNNRILLGTIELECADAGSNIEIVAADSLGFFPYDDGFISDCDLTSQFPLDAAATIYQLCSADADCDDDNTCTEEYCDTDTDRCVYTALENGTPCDDGVSCNDPDICVDGVCVFQGDPCCEVTIDPKTADVYFGQTIQFTATEKGDCNATPCYTWEIAVAEGTGNTGNLTGSTINASGLFTAGDTAGEDIVRVTDKCSNDAPFDEATVTVTGSATTTTVIWPTTTTTIVAECNEDADCDDDVFCNGAETCEDGVCQDGTPVDCPDDGQFCNGTESCNEQTDACVSSGNPCGAGTVCNEATDTCDPLVLASIKELLPPSWFQSRWVPILRLLRIIGSNTNFEARVSEVTFEPERAVWGFRPRVTDEENIRIWVYILPQWFSRPLDGPVEVTVTTGSEVVSANWDIELLPFPLDAGSKELQ